MEIFTHCSTGKTVFETNWVEEHKHHRGFCWKDMQTSFSKLVWQLLWIWIPFFWNCCPAPHCLLAQCWVGTPCYPPWWLMALTAPRWTRRKSLLLSIPVENAVWLWQRWLLMPKPLKCVMHRCWSIWHSGQKLQMRWDSCVLWSCRVRDFVELEIGALWLLLSKNKYGKQARVVTIHHPKASTCTEQGA